MTLRRLFRHCIALPFRRAVCNGPLEGFIMPATFYYVLIGILLGAVQLAVGIVLGRLLGRYLGADSRSCGSSSQGRRAVLQQIRGITRRIESDVADYRRFLESASQGFLHLPQTDALDEAVLDAVRRLVAANQMLQERSPGRRRNSPSRPSGSKNNGTRPTPIP